MGRRTGIEWRAEFFKDLIKRAPAAGVKEFDRKAIKAFVDEWATKKANKKKGWPASIKKYYTRASRMTPKGWAEVVRDLVEFGWPGYTPRRRRINQPEKPKKKAKKAPEAKKKPEDPYGDLPPPPPPPPVGRPTVGACVACGGSGKNSKGGECVPCSKNKPSVEVEQLPPPPPPPLPPIPTSMGDDLRETWNETHPEDPDPGLLETPIPPPPPPRTYGEKPKGDVRHEAQSYRICFEVDLQPTGNGQRTLAVVQEEMNRYLVEQTGFESNVSDVVFIRGNTYDLLTGYSCHVTKPFEMLLEHPWTEDVRAKPAADFGEASLPG